MASKASLAFSEDTVFHYLAEGAANIVYCISEPVKKSTPEPSVIEEYGEGTPPPSIFDDDSINTSERTFQGKSNLS